jgi:hypothetical protein
MGENMVVPTPGNLFWSRLLETLTTFPRRRHVPNGLFRRSGLDRRRWPRAICHNLVKCSYLNAEERGWVTNLGNISQGGLKMFCPERLRKDDILKLTVNFPKNDLNITVAGSVVWATPKSNGVRGYDIGVSFLEVPATAGRFLAHYVNCHTPDLNRN